MKASEVVKLLGQIGTVARSFEYSSEVLEFQVRIVDVEMGGYEMKYLIEPVAGSGQRWVKSHNVTLAEEVEPVEIKEAA